MSTENLTPEMAAIATNTSLETDPVKTSLKRLPSTHRRHLETGFSSQDAKEFGKKVSHKGLQSFRNPPLAPGHEYTFFDSPEWRNSPAFGLWVLFWTVLGVQMLTRIAWNVLNNGYILPGNIVRIMYRGLVDVAIADAGLYLGMYVTYFIQVLVKNGIINWNGWGWKLQHIWQAIYLFFFLGIAKKYDFPWIAQIFLVLHNLTFLMKQHSYAMYNGHLFSVIKELKSCIVLKERSESGSPEMKEIEERIEFCETELNMQSTKVRYPSNVNLHNFFMYTMYPTVVYQIEYHRTEKIRWSYVAAKLSAIFGILGILLMVTEEGLYPVAMQALKLRETLSVKERLQHYPWIMLSCIGPFITSYLLVFYLIWDAVLNCIAELTRFEDREFYRHWWNTVSWDQFARDWNVPVHNFLHRHVYSSSIAHMHLSRFGATVVTFVLSSLVHELTMYVIFDRVRGYLFCMQLSQIVLTIMCRTKFMKSRPLLGQIIFWIGICTGPSMLCSLYLVL